MKNPAYKLSDEGALTLTNGEVVISSIPSEGELALLYDSGGMSGVAVLLKHGPEPWVRADFERLRNALGGGGLDVDAEGGDRMRSVRLIGREMAAELRMVKIPVSSLTDGMVDEINACLSTSGRIGKLEDRLRDMTPSSPRP